MASQPQHQRRELVRRPTTMAAAFETALNKLGYETDNVRMPVKREPTWRVTRKG